jgi:uncharacterized protein (DUF433 family)
MENWQKYISINPKIRSGKPCISGTRITVSDVLSYLASGMSMEEIIEDFPTLNKEKISEFDNSKENDIFEIYSN